MTPDTTSIESAKEATEIAVDFLKQYFAYHIPVSAKLAENTWIVKVNVGVFSASIAEVRIDARTRDVTSYEVP